MENTMVKTLTLEGLKTLRDRLQVELDDAERELYRREIMAKQAQYGVVLGESIVRIIRCNRTRDFLVVSMAEHEKVYKHNTTMSLLVRRFKRDGTLYKVPQYLYKTPSEVKVVGKFNPGQKSEIVYD